ncbi:MAG: replicative DNA helicase [bacterium]|nr:replicative DNA helicase [bacterium]
MAKESNKKDPFSLEAEQAVLGGIFVDNEALTYIVKDVLVSGKDEFYDNRNRMIYQAMIELEKMGMRYDFATVCSHLESSTTSPDLWGGRSYLLKLVDAFPSSANLQDYAELVHNNYLKRRLLVSCNNIVEMTRNGEEVHDFVECVDYAENQLADLIKNRRTATFSQLSDVSNQILNKTRDMLTRMDFNDVVGLKTGFTKLDGYTQGFQPEQLIILAARPGGGKSAFALNIAKNIADRNPDSHVAFFSLEMAVEMVTTRLLANAATIDSKKIKSGRMTSQEFSKLETQIALMNNVNIHFSDESYVTVSDIKTMCRKLYQKHGLSLIVVDYLQLIDGSSDKKGSAQRNRQEEVASISRGLKLLARELKCPVLALSQLSRGVEQRKDNKITMADLRESGAIEQDADIILFLNKQDENSDVITLSIAKNREGENGVDIPLLFEKQYSKFSNVADNENPNSEQ